MHRTWLCWPLVIVLTSLWFISHDKTAEAGEPQELIRQTLTGILAVLTDDTLKAPEQHPERLRRIAQVVSQSFDLKEMAGAPWAIIGIGLHRRNKRNSSNSLALCSYNRW